jgi:4-amino-4-deoxy-L-arabinose transferase-like glycosyltransferase
MSTPEGFTWPGLVFCCVVALVSTACVFLPGGHVSTGLYVLAVGVFIRQVCWFTLAHVASGLLSLALLSLYWLLGWLPEFGSRDAFAGSLRDTVQTTLEAP